jgi:coenzyme F420 hydrogenase subunit beta
VNTILETLEHETGPLAYVGLPHQVFAIRRLQALKHPSVRAIRYVLGPFFGNELSGQAVDSFLRKFGATKDQIASLAYRAGEWPGYMQVVLKDGRTLRMPKFHANYLIPFHITQNSLLSHDLTNEFTDVSGGDAWAPVYEERGKGFSLAIARTEVGEDLLRRMEGAGILSLTDVTEADVLAMQSHGLDFKKRGTFLRLQQREARDLRTYRYGLTLTGVSLGRRAFEWLLGLTFAVCHWPLSQWVADVIPDRIIGAVFVWLRTRWKAATKGVKRAGWGQTELRLTEV